MSETRATITTIEQSPVEPAIGPPRPRRRRWLPAGLVVVSVAWLLVACTPRQGTVKSYLGPTVAQASISNHVETRMAELGIPGLSMAIINRGEVVYSEHFGHADIEADRPVDDTTIFEGASLSKPVFAQFVMTFVEGGVLDLDRPLHEYLPHPDVEGDRRAEAITARMVLSHRSGFPNWRSDRFGGTLPINFEPGTDFEYSGEGYQYLAMVLKEIVGTDWAGMEQLFQQRIAEPLGLKNTVFIQTAETRAAKAEPYDADVVKIDWRNDPVTIANDAVFVAPASIHTNTADFTRWMVAIMNRELLTTESYQELLAAHSVAPSDDLGLSYTLGFYQPDVPFTNMYGHGGNNEGFTSFFMLDADDDWGFVLFTNSQYGESFGEEMLLYLFAGPSVPKLIAVALAIVVVAVSALVVMVRTIRRLTGRGATVGLTT